VARQPVKKRGKTKEIRLTSANRRRAKIIGYFLAPLLVFIGYPTLMVACGGMLPTLVAFIVDNRKERYAARTVGYLNSAGVFIVCLDMWGGDHTWQHALDLLAQPINYLIMFGAAAVGWVLYFIIPPITNAYLAIHNDLRMKSLNSDQEKLVKEWGTGVRRNAPSLDTKVRDDADEEESDGSEAQAGSPNGTSSSPEDVPSMAEIGKSGAS